MTGHPPYQLSVIFASLVGAAGVGLSLLAWWRFRGSPFGRALAVLPAFMLLLAVYHPILLVYPSLFEVALLLETAAFALLLAFVVLMVRIHRRMSRRRSGG